MNPALGIITARVLMRLLDDNDLQIAVTPGHGQAHIFRMAIERHVDTGVSDRDVADFDSLQKRRKDRADKAQAAAGGIDTQAKTGLQQ